MKFSCLPALFLICLTSVSYGARGDYVERFDTPYNNLTVEKRGTVVELRARSRRGEFIESAVDLARPLHLVVGYTRTLYAGLFFQPRPERVLMIGLGGAGFHRLFAHAYPQALLQTVELDPKVLELCQSHMDFAPTEQTPVAIMDGRLFVKRDNRRWSWIILDAFRGGYVPPHLKTEEFYRECARRLDDDGVFMSNLHQGTDLFYADIRTIQAVFPQVVLFRTARHGNVIICAVKYRQPDITAAGAWTPAANWNPRLAPHLDLQAIANERIPIPTALVAAAPRLSDDFAPAEFLDISRSYNTGDEQAPSKRR